MKRRVLFLISTTEMGGAEVVVRNLVKYGRGAVVEPVVATLGFGSGDVVRELRSLGVPVHVARPHRLRNLVGSLWNVLWLARLMRRERTELVVTNGGHPHVYAAVAACLAGRRAVWYVMTVLRRPLRRNNVIDRIALALPTTYYLMASRACRDAFLEAFPRRRARLSVVHHGYDPDLYSPSMRGEQVRSELSIPSDVPVVAIVARLQRWKGQEYFIRSIPRVVECCPDVKCLLVGGSVFGLEPRYVDELRALVARLRLGSTVLFTGQRKDVPAILAASDLVVHGSVEPEPGANAIVEAMAMGKPVVATDIGCSVELLGKTGRAGVLVPPRDPDAMGEAIAELLQDPERRARLGRRARRRASRLFTAPVMAGKVEAVLASLRSS